MIIMTTDFRNSKKIVYIPDTRPSGSTLRGGGQVMFWALEIRVRKWSKIRK